VKGEAHVAVEVEAVALPRQGGDGTDRARRLARHLRRRLVTLLVLLVLEHDNPEADDAGREREGHAGDADERDLPRVAQTDDGARDEGEDRLDDDALGGAEEAEDLEGKSRVEKVSLAALERSTEPSCRSTRTKRELQDAPWSHGP